MKFKIGSLAWFPFELQILTFLQHDWDQKQHAIYEDPESFPQSIKALFRNLSNQLHKADKTFGKIRPLVDEFLLKRRSNKIN